MNFKKLMVSGIAMGAITVSSINLSYADTELNVLNEKENEDSKVTVDQIEDNSILNIASDDEIINKILEKEEETTISTLVSKTDLAVRAVTSEDIDAGALNFKNNIKSISSAVVNSNANQAYVQAAPEQAKVVKETKATVAVTETKAKETTEAKTEAVTETATEATQQIEEATTTATTKPTEAAKTSTKWSTSAVNVRQEAKTSSSSLGVVAKGTKLTGTMENGWLKVSYNGKTGYVYSSNLSDTEVKETPVKETEKKEETKPNNNNNNNSNQTNNDKDFAYSRVVTVKATAYSMNEPGLDYRTALGVDLRQNPNVIAVDRSVIPLGTKVYVEGYGYAIAADTGGAIKGNKIDVHFNSLSKMNQWGVKNNVKVYILK